MNNQSFSLLRKNKLRLFKGIFRHYWQPLIAFLATAIFSVVYFLHYIIADVGIAALAPYRRYAYLLIALCCGIRIFFVKTPIFKLYSAAVLYTCNSPFFRNYLRRKKLLASITGGLLALCAALIFHQFTVGYLFFIDFLKLTLLIHSNLLLAWFFYHTSGIARLITIPAFAVMLPSLCTDSALSLLLILPVAVASSVYDSRFLQLNMTKYEEKLRYLDAVMTAQSQKNNADMLRFAEENRTSTVSGLRFHSFRPTQRTAILVKSLLDLLRMQKQIWILIIGMFAGGYLLRSESLQGFFQEETNAELLIFPSALCTAMAFQFLFQTAAKNAATFIEKSRRVLMLPFSAKQVFLAYFPVPAMLSAFFMLGMDVLYKRLSLYSLAFLLLLFLSYGLLLFAKIFDRKIGKLFPALSGSILFFGVIMHYGFLL